MNSRLEALRINNEAKKKLSILKARKDLLSFTLYTKKDYKINWHHRFLAKKLTAFALGKIRFLMVFVPPRHGKSELVSRRLPAFLHGLYPECEIMAASYLDDLAGDMAIDTQEIMDSNEYQVLFPKTKLSKKGARNGVRHSQEHRIYDEEGKSDWRGLPRERSWWFIYR